MNRATLARIEDADTFAALGEAALGRARSEVQADAALLDLEDAASQPVLAVAGDHLDGAAVHDYLAGGFRDDRLRARARDTRAPALSEELLDRREAREHAARLGCPDAVCRHIAVAPLLGAGGVMGTLQVARERRLPDGVAVWLAGLAAEVSVRLAVLGVRGPGIPAVRLTGRQRDVARLISRGFTNASIARELGVTVDGIKKHVKVMMEGLDVANRAELAVVAARALALPAEPDGRAPPRGLHVVRWSPGGREE